MDIVLDRSYMQKPGRPELSYPMQVIVMRCLRNNSTGIYYRGYSMLGTEVEVYTDGPYLYAVNYQYMIATQRLEKPLNGLSYPELKRMFNGIFILPSKLMDENYDGPFYQRLQEIRDMMWKGKFSYEELIGILGVPQ